MRRDLLGRATRKGPPAFLTLLGTRVADPSPAL